MSEPLPVLVDAMTYAERGRSLRGIAPVSAFVRLAEWLHSDAGELGFQLDFGRDDQGRRQLRGRVSGGIELLCQRCLVAFTHDLERDFELVLVESDAEAATLPEELEGVIVGTARAVHVVDLVEDELILALPLIPRCEGVRVCRPAVELLDSDEIISGEEQGGSQKPFSDLADHFQSDPTKQ